MDVVGFKKDISKIPQYSSTLRVDVEDLPVAVDGLVIVPCLIECNSNVIPEFIVLRVMPQCTPVVLDGAIALLSLTEFKGEVVKNVLFTGIAYSQPFYHPFGIKEIVISYRSLNHQLFYSVST